MKSSERGVQFISEEKIFILFHCMLARKTEKKEDGEKLSAVISADYKYIM